MIAKKGFKNTHNTAIHAQWHRKLKATFLRVTSKLFLGHNKHSKFPVLNTNFFGQRQWASKWNNSLAHEEKPLVQKEAQKKINMWGNRTFMPFLIESQQKLPVPGHKQSLDLPISWHYCLRPIPAPENRTFFLWRIAATDKFSPNLVENFWPFVYRSSFSLRTESNYWWSFLEKKRNFPRFRVVENLFCPLN